MNIQTPQKFFLTQKQADYVIDALLEDDLILIQQFYNVMTHFDFCIDKTTKKLPPFLSHKIPIVSLAVFLHAKNCVSYMIEKDCSFTLTDSREYTILHYAAAADDLEMFKRFEIAYISDNEYDDFIAGENPFHIAAAFGSLSILFYIHKKFPKSKMTSAGDMALHLAIDNGHYDTVHFLVQIGCMGSKNDYLYSTFLYRAAIKNQVLLVDFFIKMGCNPGNPLRDDISLLSYAAAANALDVVKFLCENSFIPSINSTINPPLVFAAQNGHKRIIEYLLDQKFSVNIANEINGKTPFWASVENNHEEIAIFLLQKGADYRIKPKILNTTILALIIQHDMIKLLLELSKYILYFPPELIDHAIKSNSPLTLRFLFVHMSDHSSIDLINLMKKPNISLQCMRVIAEMSPMWTKIENAFNYAYSLGDTESARFVLSYGIDFSNISSSQQKYKGRTKKQQFFYYLLYNGGCNNAPNSQYSSVGSFAFFSGFLGNIAYILENNISFDPRFLIGTSFLPKAIKYKKFELFAQLIKINCPNDPNDDVFETIFKEFRKPISLEIQKKLLNAINLLFSNSYKMSPSTYNILFTVPNNEVYNYFEKNSVLTRTEIVKYNLIPLALKSNSYFLLILINLIPNITFCKDELLKVFNSSTKVFFIKSLIKKTNFKDFINPLLIFKTGSADLLNAYYESGNKIEQETIMSFIKTMNPPMSDNFFHALVINGFDSNFPSFLGAIIKHTNVTDLSPFISFLDSTYENMTPLVLALLNQKPILAYKLIKKGVNINLASNGITPVMAAAMFPSNLFILHILMKFNSTLEENRITTNSVSHLGIHTKQTNPAIIALERKNKYAFKLLKYKLPLRRISGGKPTAIDLGLRIGVPESEMSILFDSL